MLYYSWMETLVMYSQEGVLLLKLRFTSCMWCLTPIILHLGGWRKTVLDANLSYTVSSKPVNAIELSLSQNTQPTCSPRCPYIRARCCTAKHGIQHCVLTQQLGLSSWHASKMYLLYMLNALSVKRGGQLKIIYAEVNPVVYSFIFPF